MPIRDQRFDVAVAGDGGRTAGVFNRESKNNAVRRSAGFTLAELLIVIGIIALLISILVPTVSKVRVAGQKVATQALINRLSQACEAYYQDFTAYPGPFDDVQLVNASMSAPTPTPLLAPGGPALALPATPTTPIGQAPTSSENLFLGLCGGLRVIVGTPNAFVYDEDLAKRSLGPSGLSLTVAKRSQAYFELTAGDISSTLESANPLNVSTGPTTPGQWWVTGNGYTLTATPPVPFLGDSRIYEFVDTFRTRHPILYMRSNRGVVRTAATSSGAGSRSGFIFDAAFPAETSPYQYRPDQLQSAYSNTGLDSKNGNVDRTGVAWHASTADYPLVMNDAGTLTKFQAGDERYFVNEQTSTGNPTTLTDGNKVLSPKQKDKYILISAGPDGLYGTADDISNSQ